MSRAAAACLLVLAAGGIFAGGIFAGTAQADFTLALDESTVAQPAQAPAVFARLDDLGVRRLRVNLNWSSVAPDGAVKPAGFDARDAADPAYRWTAFDALVRSAAAAGKELIVTVGGAPVWAQAPGPRPDDAGAAGGFKVNAADYADFAHAVAVRYDGAFADPLVAGAALPRVRFWQAWNEPNLPMYLYPATVQHYRPLLNGFYDAVKAVDPSNVVITAGLAPVKSSKQASFPLRFAAELLCLRHAGAFQRERFSSGGCGRPRARFDALSIHPYSLLAKPGQRAAIDGDVFVADVPTLTKMLRVAARARLTVTSRPALWVTEFAWFTNPPNKSIGDPPGRAGPRVAEALYRMWAAGVQVVTWHMLTDRPDNGGFLIPGGGLLYEDGRPKPTYGAFRMPLHVSNVGAHAIIWGRSPLPSQYVSIDAARGGLSRRVLSGPDGVFTLRIGRRLHGAFAARQGAVSSLVEQVH